MEIKAVEYRRLVTFGHYENQVIGATAVVGDYDAHETLAKLKEFVNGELAKLVVMNEVKADTDAEVAACRANVKQMQEDMDGWRQRWVRARQFLEQHGIPTGKFEDCPF